MEAAKVHGIPGIDGDCGGACACGTCHCFIDPDWAKRVGERSPEEASMLEFVEDAGPTSRLACQIRMTAELDGVLVRLPKNQH